MKLTHLLPLAAAMLTLASAGLRAQEPITQEIPSIGTVKVQPPAKWEKSSELPPGTPPGSLMLKTKGGTPEETGIILIFMADPSGQLATRPALEAAVKSVTAQFLPGAVEKEAAIVPLDSKTGPGAYATITDKKLVDQPAKANDFKYVTNGMVAVKGAVLIFTLMTNDLKGADFQQALKIVADGITVTPAAASAPAAPAPAQ